MNRRTFMLLAALAGGYLSGLVLSEMMGIVGVLLFQRDLGIRFLPVYLALLFGVAALIADDVIRRKSK